MQWARVVGEGGTGSGRLEIERDTLTGCSVTVPSAAVGAAVGGGAGDSIGSGPLHTAHFFDSLLMVTGSR